MDKGSPSIALGDARIHWPLSHSGALYRHHLPRSAVLG